MDIRSLRYFSLAFEEKNLTAAARRAYVAQPSISSAISGLEEELSEQLFVRHKKGVTPTEAGYRLYPLARDMLNRMEAIKGSFQKGAGRQPLIIGLQASLDPLRMEQFFRMLKEQEAGLELRLVGLDQPADIRIMSEDIKSNEGEFHPLWEEDYVVVLPSGHPLSLLPELEIKDLAGSAIIHRDYCEYRALMDQYADLSLEIAAMAPSEEWAASLVAAGVGIAFMPSGCVGGKAGVVTRRLKDVSLHRRVGIVILSEIDIPDAVLASFTTFSPLD